MNIRFVLDIKICRGGSESTRTILPSAPHGIESRIRPGVGPLIAQTSHDDIVSGSRRSLRLIRRLRLLIRHERQAPTHVDVPPFAAATDECKGEEAKLECPAAESAEVISRKPIFHAFFYFARSAKAGANFTATRPGDPHLRRSTRTELWVCRGNPRGSLANEKRQLAAFSKGLPFIQSAKMSLVMTARERIT